MNSPTKPSDIGPFDITCKQVKSHPRYLWELQEPGFHSVEGMGGNPYNHSNLAFIQDYIMCA
jgi:hypothetical protein